MSLHQSRDNCAPTTKREPLVPEIVSDGTKLVPNGNDHSHFDWEIYHTHSDGSRHLVHYPANLAADLVEVLRKLASGCAQTLDDNYQFLTFSQASKILFVSEKFLEDLVSNGSLSVSKQNGDPKISAIEMFKYKCDRDRKNAVLLDELIENDLDLV